jgi:hypothetical protein
VEKREHTVRWIAGWSFAEELQSDSPLVRRHPASKRNECDERKKERRSEGQRRESILPPNAPILWETSRRCRAAYVSGVVAALAVVEEIVTAVTAVATQRSVTPHHAHNLTARQCRTTTTTTTTTTWPHNTTESTAPYSTTQRHTTQRNATQRNATQRNATQRNATQRNATQRNATQRNATQRNQTARLQRQGEQPQANSSVADAPQVKVGRRCVGIKLEAAFYLRPSIETCGSD